jgi:hypothetical protein
MKYILPSLESHRMEMGPLHQQYVGSEAFSSFLGNQYGGPINVLQSPDCPAIAGQFVGVIPAVQIGNNPDNPFEFITADGLYEYSAVDENGHFTGHLASGPFDATFADCHVKIESIEIEGTISETNLDIVFTFEYSFRDNLPATAVVGNSSNTTDNFCDQIYQNTFLTSLDNDGTCVRDHVFSGQRVN